MEVDEFQRQVSKFQRVSSLGSTTTSDNNNNSNSIKIATHGGGVNGHESNEMDLVGSGGVARLCGWPASRIVRVSRASGGKDRHSKVLTSKGLRDRRVRLSVSTAIQFYDLQDRLGYDQPSKAVEWLLKAAASSIDELPSLDPAFVGGGVGSDVLRCHQMTTTEDKVGISTTTTNTTQAGSAKNKSKSPECSSTSETSKGSGLSLSRSENRIKARERARVMASKKENVLNQVNNLSENNNSSFTDLLTGGGGGGGLNVNVNVNVNANNITTVNRPESRIHWTTSSTPMDYLFTRPSQQLSSQHIQNPQFHQQNHPQNQNQNHQFSFLQETFPPTTTTGSSDGGYNLSFSMTPSSGGSALGPGYSRGTLQSNLPSSILPHNHHHNLQRFHSAPIDGPQSTNLPFFIVPNTGSDHFSGQGGYHFSYGGGGDGVGRHSEHHHKEKSKN